VILVDNGGIIPPPGDTQNMTAAITLEAMNLMDYAAMNVGWSDLSLGADSLKKEMSRANFPLLSSNLMYKDSKLSFGKKYVVRRVGNVRIGIIGLLSTKPPEDILPALEKGCLKHEMEKISLGNVALADNLEIIPPEEALKKLIPEIREQADLILLLSQCGYDATRSLVDKIEGIDMAISGSAIIPKEDETALTPILPTAYQEGELGYVRLLMDGKSTKFVEQERKMIELDELVAPDNLVEKITGEDIKETIIRKQKQKLEADAKVLQKLSPIEYYQKLLKDKQVDIGGKK